MDVKDIKRLLDAAAATDVSELTLETGDYKLSVKRGADVPLQSGPTTLEATAAPTVVAAPIPVAEAAPATPAETSNADTATPTPSTSRSVEVSAPIVGTFYSAAAPDAPAYVQVGDRVETGTVLCIIEAMKLMNEIEAEVAGTVTEILVKNEEPVEYGQTLFRIDPG